MHNLSFNSKFTVVKHMVAGMLLLLAVLAIFWTVANFDVVVKAVRYPEAVRAMKVNVEIMQAK